MKKLAIIITAIACISCKTQIIEPEIAKIEQYVVLEKFKEAIILCEEILYADTKEYSQNTRNIAADYLLLCLLKTGDLNNKYYNYKAQIKELLYPKPPEETLGSACFAFEIGMPIQKDEIEILLLYNEQNKQSVVFWNVFEKNSIITNTKRYYNLLKNNISPNIPEWAWVDRGKIISEWRQKTKSTPTEIKTPITGDFLSDIVSMFNTNKDSKETLEAYAAMMLCFGKLNTLSEIAERYRRLNYVRLPYHVQEAAIIVSQNPYLQSYCGFEIEEKLRGQYINFWQAVDNMYIGKESRQSIIKKFGDSYTCHFFSPMLSDN